MLKGCFYVAWRNDNDEYTVAYILPSITFLLMSYVEAFTNLNVFRFSHTWNVNVLTDCMKELFYAELFRYNLRFTPVLSPDTQWDWTTQAGALFYKTV